MGGPNLTQANCMETGDDHCPGPRMFRYLLPFYGGKNPRKVFEKEGVMRLEMPQFFTLKRFSFLPAASQRSQSRPSRPQGNRADQSESHSPFF